MQIAVFADRPYQEIIRNHIDLSPALRFRKLDLICAADHDSFTSLSVDRPEMVLVMSDGAKGMEAVIAGRKCYPQAPVAWFSDDAEFGAQSYRLGCSYFAPLPLTEEKLLAALKACRPKQVFPL